MPVGFSFQQFAESEMKYVQSASNAIGSSVSGSLTATLANIQQQDNINIVFASSSVAGDITSVTDTAGNVYTLITSVTNAQANLYCYTAKITNAIFNNIISVNYNTTGLVEKMVIAEYASNLQSLQGSSTATNGAGNITIGLGVNKVLNLFIVGFIGDGTTNNFASENSGIPYIFRVNNGIAVAGNYGLADCLLTNATAAAASNSASLLTGNTTTSAIILGYTSSS